MVMGNTRLTAGKSALGSALTGGPASREPHVIVFDEAHNIDNVCIEALSINVTVLDLERCRHNIKKLQEEVGQ